jgi:hypothetical protein
MAKQTYCGVEQEFGGKYPVEWTSYSWFPNGGRTYSDSDLIETNTPLIPLTDDMDPSVVAYNHVLADRARVLQVKKRDKVTGLSMHFNFTSSPSVPIEPYMRAFAPAFAYLFGRTTGGIAFKEDSERYEIVSEPLRTPGAIRGGLALGISISRAISEHTLIVNDFLYALPPYTEIMGLSNRKFPLFYEDIFDPNEEPTVETIAGRKTLKSVFGKTLNFLKPHIIRYCSQDAYDQLYRVYTGEEMRDFDFDMIDDQNEVLSNTVIHKKQLLRLAGRRSLAKVIEQCNKPLTPHGEFLGKQGHEHSPLLGCEALDLNYAEWEGVRLRSMNGDLIYIERHKIRGLQKIIGDRQMSDEAKERAVYFLGGSFLSNLNQMLSNRSNLSENTIRELKTSGLIIEDHGELSFTRRGNQLMSILNADKGL